MPIQPALKKGTVTYAIYFYILITVGSFLSIALSVQGGHYLSSLHALGLLLVICAIGATVLRSDYLNTDVRKLGGLDEAGDEDRLAADLPFSAEFWELIYVRYVDNAVFRRVELGMYVMGVLSLGLVRLIVNLP